MSRPIADGPLWAHLREHHARRLIAVLRVNDLRLAEVQISRELSWERTAQDIFWELIHNPRVKALAEKTARRAAQCRAHESGELRVVDATGDGVEE